MHNNIFAYKKAQPNWLGKEGFLQHLTTEIVQFTIRS
tara:strand:+ start:49244 stop:49354 length:111 start_codon:yes stop_codon:yes gene_type:complete